ncbi:hypothetical protein V8953_23515 [Klebsiella michiganensis]|nr:hypothetical protein [Klebsiella michiganensis]EKU0274792.1 hypothetical protein [Klebsiella pneumoniae]ELT1807368.1 hypothetical protein [Klebsiella michiganensis]MDV0340464.1 hypothetical protein [Klebsiella michiganensis]MDV0356251.1 hypothetical protein [Klebsiella michiganensis]MDV0404160.1 hypothetical protein [Klebsiella michiganensis]
MLEQFKEIASSAISTASERVRNPVLGAFVFSWCSFNWNPLLFLFFSKSVIEEKINYISSHTDAYHSLLYPALCTFALCVIVPWFNNIVVMFQKMPLQNIDNFKHNKSLRDVKSAIELRKLEAQRDITYDSVKVGFESEIQSLKNDLINQQEYVSSFLQERDSLIEKIRLLEKELAAEKIKSKPNTRIANKFNSKNNRKTDNAA